MKTTAESLEQVDPVGSAVGTTRAAVRWPISEARDVLFRKGDLEEDEDTEYVHDRRLVLSVKASTLRWIGAGDLFPALNRLN